MIRPPEPLQPLHRLEDFRSGEPALDQWLLRRGLPNQRSGASRTFVLAEEDRVWGYYSLAAGSVLCAEAPGRVRRNMPDPLPVVILARLAVDRTLQGRGFGALLLRDGVLRTLQAADQVGIRALLVHALHERAAAFYLRFGFAPSPLGPSTFLLLLEDARRSLAPEPQGS